MMIKTKAFGEIEVSEKQRLIFKEGIFGFEDLHNYVLLDIENNSPFYWLQSEEIQEIAFLVVNPVLIIENYKLDADKEDIIDLGIEHDDEMLLFSIVTLYDDPTSTTVNLLGPLVINRIKHVGKQIVNKNDTYTVRYPLLKSKEK